MLGDLGRPVFISFSLMSSSKMGLHPAPGCRMRPSIDTLYLFKPSKVIKPFISVTFQVTLFRNSSWFRALRT